MNNKNSCNKKCLLLFLGNLTVNTSTKKLAPESRNASHNIIVYFVYFRVEFSYKLHSVGAFSFSHSQRLYKKQSIGHTFNV